MRRHGEEIGALAVHVALLGDVDVHHQPPQVFAGRRLHRHGGARQEAVPGPLQLQLVAGVRFLVREDLLHPRKQRLAVARDRLLQLAPVDLLVALPVHGAQRNTEDHLDLVRGRPQHAFGVEEGDPVGIRVDHRAQLGEAPLRLHPLAPLPVALLGDVAHQPRIAHRHRRAARQRVGEVHVVLRVAAAFFTHRGQRHGPDRFLAVEHGHRDRRSESELLGEPEHLLVGDGSAQELVGDLLEHHRFSLQQGIRFHRRHVPALAGKNLVEPLGQLALRRIGMVLGDRREGAVGLHEREPAPVAGLLRDQSDHAPQGLDLVGADVLEQRARDVGEDPLVPLRLPKPVAFEVCAPLYHASPMGTLLP